MLALRRRCCRLNGHVLILRRIDFPAVVVLRHRWTQRLASRCGCLRWLKCFRPSASGAPMLMLMPFSRPAERRSCASCCKLGACTAVPQRLSTNSISSCNPAMRLRCVSRQGARCLPWRAASPAILPSYGVRVGGPRTSQRRIAVGLMRSLPVALGPGTGLGLSSCLTCRLTFARLEGGTKGAVLGLCVWRQSVCRLRIRPGKQGCASAQAAGLYFRRSPIAEQRPYHVACDTTTEDDMHLGACAIVTSSNLDKQEYQLIRYSICKITCLRNEERRLGEPAAPSPSRLADMVARWLPSTASDRLRKATCEATQRPARRWSHHRCSQRQCHRQSSTQQQS